MHLLGALSSAWPKSEAQCGPSFQVPSCLALQAPSTFQLQSCLMLQGFGTVSPDAVGASAAGRSMGGASTDKLEGSHMQTGNSGSAAQPGLDQSTGSKGSNAGATGSDIAHSGKAGAGGVTAQLRLFTSWQQSQCQQLQSTAVAARFVRWFGSSTS